MNNLPSFDEMMKVKNQGNETQSFEDGGMVGALPSFDQMAQMSAQPAPVAAPMPTTPGLPSFDQMLAENQAVEAQREKYGTPTQQAIAGLEGLAKGLAGPLATAAEKALGVPPEAIEARAAVNPTAHISGEALGLVGPALATMGTSALARTGLTAAAEALPAIQAASKFTQAGALEGLAHATGRALGLGAEGAGVISKIGSAAVRGAVENAAFQAGDEVSKQILHPDFTSKAAASALVDITGAGLIGGFAGGAIGAVPELWKATAGKQTSGVLHALSKKMGGIDTVTTEPVQEAIQKLGIEVEPQIIASLSDDPEIKQLASVLNQTDTTSAGRAYQETAKKFKNRLDDIQLEILGKDPEKLPSEFSNYQTGADILNAAKLDTNEIIAPIKNAFEAKEKIYNPYAIGPSIAEKEVEGFKIQQQIEKELKKQGKLLERAVKSNDVEAAVKHGANVEALQQSLKEVAAATKVPGVKDLISEEIGKLVDKNSWAGSDHIMKEVNRLLKRVPELKTIGDLGKEYTTITNNTKFKGDPTLEFAGKLLKNVIKDAEHNVIAQQIGKVEGLEAANIFSANRRAYAQTAELFDQIQSRLGIKGGPSSLPQKLEKMAIEDPEKALRNLLGKNDARWIQVVQQNFPRTAEQIKKAFVDQLVAKAVKAAKNGEKINATVFKKSLKELTAEMPELRDFVLPKQAQEKLEAVNLLSEKFADPTHNYSNSARTVAKLLSGHFDTAMGLATGLLTHDPVAGAVVGLAAKAIGKEAPDAVRLSLLKFLGSNKPINAPAFKAAVDFAQAVIKGESMIVRGSAAVFKAGAKVLPEYAITTERDRERLKKDLKKIERNPSALLMDKNEQAHYMPEQAAQISQASTRVASYLAQNEPKPQKMGVLDKEIPVSKQAEGKFNRLLDIAHQPLSVLQFIKDGTLQPEDVQHLRAMYPEVYDRLTQELSHNMTDKVHDEEPISYRTRQSLSLFLGNALDVTMTPASLQAIQATFAGKPSSQQQAGMQPPAGVKHSTAALNKAPKGLMTSMQAREWRGMK